MYWESKTQGIRGSSVLEPCLPQVEQIIEFSEKGVVFHNPQPFDFGVILELGFHLVNTADFIDITGIVVESVPLSHNNAKITVMFDALTDSQKEQIHEWGESSSLRLHIGQNLDSQLN